VSETLAAGLRRPGLVLRPLDPPVRTPLLMAWRTPTALVRRLAEEAAGAAGA